MTWRARCAGSARGHHAQVHGLPADASGGTSPRPRRSRSLRGSPRFRKATARRKWRPKCRPGRKTSVRGHAGSSGPSANLIYWHGGLSLVEKLVRW